MTQHPDTIGAISTPMGVGGLGVIRLSGPKAIDIAQLLTGNKKTPSLLQAASHTLHHGSVMDSDHVVDDVVYGIFREPTSYTGENVVEISCHGNPGILKDVLNLCVKHGVRLAHPGEFTQRAYLNGKCDLAQAEAVADLIHAQSSQARRFATDQLNGVLSTYLQKNRQNMLEILAALEANLDFVEEDIPPLELKQIQLKLEHVTHDLQQLLSTSGQARLFREGIKIALVGKPNVGKSSLFNALLAYDRAIVSSIPGTTRDTLEESLEWGGFRVVLTDTAGLRQTLDPIEEQGLKRTRQSQEMADVIYFLVDVSTPLSDEDFRIAEKCDKKKTLLILNKCDQAQHINEKDIQRWGFGHVISVSALTREGLPQLQKATLSFLTHETAPLLSQHAETPIVMNLRHIKHIERARSALENASRALKENRTEESISLDVRSAVEELSHITGESVQTDLLDKIFSTFCIGK